MSYLDIKNIKVKGVSVCSPKNIIENMDYDTVPLKERQKFVDSIGIERHRHADNSVCTSDLCYKAAEHLLTKINWDLTEVELLVFVSQTPDYKMPATSCLLQNRLGLSKTCMTIDISQGCSGYIYGLGVVGSLVSSGTIKKALLLVGNTQSKNTNYKDKSVYPLFSDAGSATAIEYCPYSDDFFKLSFGTDGSGENTIIIPDGGYRHPVSAESFKEEDFEGGIKRNKLNIVMHGDDVFSFVIGNLPKFTKNLFEHFNIAPDNIDYFLVHHASKFLCDKLLKKMNIPNEKAPMVLKDYGNSSNATIPLLMTVIKDEICNKQLKMYISGFGVGLSLGVGIISIGNLDCAEQIEY